MLIHSKTKLNIPIVSFDFDGVINGTVKPEMIDAKTGRILTYQSYDPNSHESYQTHGKIRQLIFQEAKHNKIVITTNRPPEQAKTIMNYIHKLGLSRVFSQYLFATDSENKVQQIKRLNSIRHYDANPRDVMTIRKNGITVIQVYPKSTHLFESN